MHSAPLLAAIDLGSNSFRLAIARRAHGQLEPVHGLKESVRLGAGLDAHGNLEQAALQRGWECLQRFAWCLTDFAPLQVRAVATQALREAHNRAVFLQRGSALLGHPIELLSGAEEAHLIYQGVARLLPLSNARRLVVDIGGCSTELVLGRQYSAHAVASFAVGSVSWSLQHFAQGQFSVAAFADAEESAKAVLAPALATHHRGTWQVAYGSSGTVTAVGDMLAAAGRPPGRITRADLDWLLQQLLQARCSERVHLAGLAPDLRPIMGGGLSVLRAIVALLDIDTLHIAQGALRQGVLYELLDRQLCSAA